MLGDAFGRWRLRQARMSQELPRLLTLASPGRQGSGNSNRPLTDRVPWPQRRDGRWRM